MTNSDIHGDHRGEDADETPAEQYRQSHVKAEIEGDLITIRLRDGSTRQLSVNQYQRFYSVLSNVDVLSNEVDRVGRVNVSRAQEKHLI